MKVFNGLSGAAGLLATSVFIVTFATASAGSLPQLVGSIRSANTVVASAVEAAGSQVANVGVQTVTEVRSSTGVLLFSYDKALPNVVTFFVGLGEGALRIVLDIFDPKYQSTETSIENYLTCLALNVDCHCTHGALGVYVAPRQSNASILQFMCLYDPAEATRLGVTACDTATSCLSKLPTDNTTAAALTTFVDHLETPFCEFLFDSIRNDECKNAANKTQNLDDCRTDYGGLHQANSPRCCSNDDPDQVGCPQGQYGKCYLELTGHQYLNSTKSFSPNYFCTGLFEPYTA